MVLSIWQILMLAIPLAFALIPLLLTAFSKRAQGGEKLGWCILVLFTSWIGYAGFLIVTHIIKNNRDHVIQEP